MEASTIEQPERLVAAPDKTVLFMSRRSELRLVKDPRYPVFGAHPGQRIGETRGVTIAFRDGQFRVPKEGEAVVMDPGGAGEARVDGPELASWLEDHRLFGDVNGGFWRVDPVAPPVSKDEMDRIVSAATEWDVTTLAEVIEQEQSGWQREDIIRVAQGSIDRIHAMLTREREALEAKEAAEQQAAAKVADAEKRADDAEKKLAAAQKKAEPKG